MTKQDIINNVVVKMGAYLDSDGALYLNNILTVELHNIVLTPDETRLSCDVVNNESIMKRFIIDQTAKGLSMSSIRQYICIMKKFFADTGLSCIDMTGQDIVDYLALRQVRDGISQSYKATLCRYFSAFFTWAYKKHHIDTDIMRDVDRVKSTQKKKERLSDDEVEKCRSITRDDARATALLELMLCTGMRCGEISHLNVDDLDFQNGTIRIWGEKSDEYRTGFMTPRFKIAMYSYLGNRREGALFVGKRGKGRVCDSTIETIAKKIAADAGCHIKATVHTYRKTFASVTYRKTKDVLLVSKLLGHASTDVTIKYYLVDDIDDMKYRMMQVA